MIPIKANDVRDLTFTLLQQAADTDAEELILLEQGGVRYKAWDLTGHTVIANVRRNGDAEVTQINPTISDPETGQCVVRIDTTLTDVTFGAGEQHRDAGIEFQVTKTTGEVITTPDQGYLGLRIFRDLDEA